MASVRFSRFVEYSRKVVGIAFNYGSSSKPPVMFLKPQSAFIKEGQAIKIPTPNAVVHHEVELGVIIGQPGRAIPQSCALDHVAGYFLALDMTDRYETKLAMENGLPWLLAKGFDTSCPVGDFIPKADIPDPDDVNLWLKVNGEMKQEGNTKHLVYSVPKLISWLSGRFQLQEGDVILTGTPDGMGPVVSGDTIDCGLDVNHQTSTSLDSVQMTFHVEDS